MPNHDDIQEALDALKTTGGNKTAAAKLLGWSRSRLRRVLVKAAAYGRDGSTPEPLPPGMRVKKTSTLYDAQTGEAKLVWVGAVAERNHDDLMAAIEGAFDAYKGHSAIPPPPEYIDADLLALYPLADFHLGLYAWGEEAGEDWDVGKACDCLRRVMAELVATTPPAETAIILNLGDFFHADNMENRTTRSGHVLDVDTRYARVLRFGVQMMIEVVELALQRHQTVTLRNLRGNHDDHSSVALTAAMGAFFHNNPRVVIDDSPATHWSYRFGKTLLGATHGDTLKKPEAMAMMLAAGCAEDWGKTCFRYFHYGHIHQAAMKEVGGVLTECHRTLAARDAWTAGQGYLSGRAMSSIVYHRNHGEQSRRVCNIPHWAA